MPTYRNDTQHKQYIDSNKLRFVAPGNTYETFKIVDNDNLTKISDEPYYNPALRVTKPTGSSDTEIDLMNTTDQLEIINNSSHNSRIYLNSKSNTPAIEVPASGEKKLHRLRGLVNNIVVEFDGDIGTGEYIITELKFWNLW